jgi:plastocyanin
MTKAGATAAGIAACVLTIAPAAWAQESQPDAEVAAAGNVFTGGLAFEPAEVTVPVGGVVRWTNTDFLVPHTATEDHGLWDLGGDYGQTPANPPGFGPEMSVQRAFEAGTHAYFCRVHPEDMRGTVTVAPALALERRRVRRTRRTRSGRRVVRRFTVRVLEARWASAAPAEGLVFDVQRRRAGGDWVAFRDGTTEPAGSFTASRGGDFEVRARLRAAGSSEAATGWSPAAQASG